jgi:hypothetical protein
MKRQKQKQKQKQAVDIKTVIKITKPKRGKAKTQAQPHAQAPQAQAQAPFQSTFAGLFRPIVNPVGYNISQVAQPVSVAPVRVAPVRVAQTTDIKTRVEELKQTPIPATEPYTPIPIPKKIRPSQLIQDDEIVEQKVPDYQEKTPSKQEQREAKRLDEIRKNQDKLMNQLLRTPPDKTERREMLALRIQALESMLNE